MQLINKMLLALVLLPRRAYSQWGIDTTQLEAILATKLLMDDRRPNTIQATRQHRQGGKEINNSTIGTILISTVMGLLYLIAFQIGNDYVTQCTAYFSMFIVMLCMMLVSDFTSVLIDVRDNQIILPKPVNDRTFIVSRLLHVFIHVCKLVIPMTLPGAVYLAINSNLAAPIIFLFLIVFATLFSIFLINAIYIVILRVTTPERFKNTISYIQIAFAIIIYGGSQVLPRMIDRSDIEDINLTQSNWLILAPSYWFASAFDTLLNWQGSPLQLLGAAMALSIPVLSIYVVVKYLAPAFNQKLAMISGSEGGAPSQRAEPSELHRKDSLAVILSKMVTKTGAERTGFLFTWQMMGRSRDFKVRVYPGIGYLIVILVMTFYRRITDGGENNLFTGFTPIIAVYLSNILLIAVIGQTAYSDKYKAAWMFFIAPVHYPGELILGGIKAAMLKFYTLVGIVIAGISIWLAGWGILPNILLAICNLLFINFGVALAGIKQLPFTQPFDETKRGSQFMRLIIWLLAGGIIGIIHFFVFQSVLAVGIFLLLSMLGNWLLIRSIKKVEWSALEQAD